MNKLSHAKRTQILAMLCEGSSMRSISRIVDVSINTVSKILVEAGEACLILHDETVKNVKASRVVRAMKVGSRAFALYQFCQFVTVND